MGVFIKNRFSKINIFNLEHKIVKYERKVKKLHNNIIMIRKDGSNPDYKMFSSL